MSQQTGEVDYPYLGIKFTIPKNWKGIEKESVYIMGSDTQPGVILLIPHEEKQLSALRSQAENGLNEEGIILNKTSEIEKIGAEGIGAEFSGTIQGSQAKAYIVAVINPFGTGVTIISATDEAHFNEQNKRLAEEIALSFKFSQPQESPVTKEWRESLKGAKLTYLNSHYSRSGSYSGYSTYGGYSSREEIILCPNQQFYFYSSSSMSIDTGGAFGGGGGKQSASGIWKVRTNDSGSAILELHFNAGKISTYRLDYKGNETYLNNLRYYRTYDHGQCE